ncbi:hypothetical protein BIW11_01827, partial [Tropilaelaps mercedesae]
MADNNNEQNIQQHKKSDQPRGEDDADRPQAWHLEELGVSIDNERQDAYSWKESETSDTEGYSDTSYDTEESVYASETEEDSGRCTASDTEPEDNNRRDRGYDQGYDIEYDQGYGRGYDQEYDREYDRSDESNE